MDTIGDAFRSLDDGQDAMFGMFDGMKRALMLVSRRADMLEEKFNEERQARLLLEDEVAALRLTVQSMGALIESGGAARHSDEEGETLDPLAREEMRPYLVKDKRQFTRGAFTSSNDDDEEEELGMYDEETQERLRRQKEERRNLEKLNQQSRFIEAEYEEDLLKELM